jgi:DDE superfamily endonuclease
MGLLTCTGRHTITGMLSAAGREQHDWSADYRLFSRGRFEPSVMFGLIQDRLVERLPQGQAVVTALDDTKCRKTGTKIPGVSYQRDPMSPPFHTNFIRAQRFAQLSLMMPLDLNAPAAARGFPIRFRHVPPPPRPGAKASPEQRAAYRLLQKSQNLSVAGAGIIEDCRSTLDSRGAEGRTLVVSVDGSYTNRTVLKDLPARTTLIGRIRKDARFSFPPSEQPVRGRRRQYGDAAPTPEALLKDDTVPWSQVRVWASGKHHDCEYKTITSIQWRKAGAHRLLRLIVIRPLGYRLTAQSRLLYRQPAFLICTDPTLPLQTVIQDYFWRWDIEVNHRDEKQLIGVGQAQVRSNLSVELVPAFAVASYSMLLLASAQTHGFEANQPTFTVPKWRARSAARQNRLTTGQILVDLRQSTPLDLPSAPLPNFDHFEDHVARHMKCSKSLISRQQAIDYAMR